MLSSIVGRISALADSELRFSAEPGIRRAQHETGSYGIVSAGVTERRLRHSAYRCDADGVIALIHRSDDVRACERACREVANMVSRGFHLGAARPPTEVDGAAQATPCLVHVRRTTDGGLEFGLPAHPGAMFEVRPAYLPNFLGGAHPVASFYQQRAGRSVVQKGSCLLRTCLQAPGLLDGDEAFEAGWGLALLLVDEARHDGPTRSAKRVARPMEILREEERLGRLGAALTDAGMDRVRDAATEIRGDEASWEAIRTLPMAGRIDDLAWGSENSFRMAG